MDRKWLEAQFGLYPEKKKADLAKALNLEAPAISKILAGGREIKAKEYILMRQFFGLPTDGQSAVSAHPNKFVIKPLKKDSTHNGMHEEDQESQNDWMLPKDLMKEKTSAAPGEVHIYRITENSMEPDYKVGEYVLIDASSKKPSPSGVFLAFDGMGEVIRQCEYIPQSNPPAIKLTATKGGYDPFVLELKDETIIGRVIAKMQWVG